MTHLCCDTPFPDFSSLWANVEIDFPPFPITIPPLPALLDPIYANYTCIAKEVSQIVQELQSYQMLFTSGAFLQPIVDFLGIDITSILPTIPGTDLTLLDLLALDPQVIYDGIEQALLDGIVFPFVPDPIFGSFSVPSIELVDVVSAVVKGYMQQVISVAVGLITQVTDILEIANMPTLPTFPTLSEIQELVLARFPEFPDLEALIASGIPTWDLLSISIPGFPALPVLPDPLFPNYSSYEQEFQAGMNALLGNLTMTPIKIVTDFCNGALSSLGFSFPLLCVDF